MDDLENELWYPVQSPVLFDEHNDSSENTVTKKQKKSELPLPGAFVVETAKETGFHRTTRLCLERIREAMLHHRWQEAAEYMACYPQQLEDTTAGPGKHYKEMIWRITIEILHHHPNSKMEDYNIIYEQMKQSGFKHYLMICLEHSFYLLLHGQIENANRHLSIAESWRHGQETAHQYQRSKLIQAYSGLLDYIIWCDKKNAPTKTSSTTAGSNKDIHYDFRQASVNLKEILKYPGVWDPFILSYVEMLEFYDAHDEAKKVLEEYAYDSMFPSNPNAHVYLYQYLQRHNAPARRLMKVLKVLHYLVPSHELMLDYNSFLLISEKPGDIKKALGVLLDMLDYACWRTSMDAWKCLKDVIDKLQLQDDWKEVVAEQMTARKEWWPAMHFTMFHASEDAVQRPQLMEVKASLTKILCPEMKLTYPAGQITKDWRI
ncbi:TATA box-binding protein-associated factor RNA polymerase I subunit A isoform X1 [Syngnathus typhle]|uniref:TATA box-binding protein-associated factor RNA polymerase I subunit A isoform X1 n=2 Tax=Syngnathus typhle TaxID=161592 RepID=UPI002A6A558C|nr:TATA box-binding protein-associated factor RNA polymerase I subunit A isoform X1 [Syngnathus typhle]XP_061126670.1 TATA box-binding protein-associated factor RNA polymerase I subunit A isoform X1 [Syngnathus typhle]